jgi:hypothetical protein
MQKGVITMTLFSQTYSDLLLALILLCFLALMVGIVLFAVSCKRSTTKTVGITLSAIGLAGTLFFTLAFGITQNLSFPSFSIIGTSSESDTSSSLPISEDGWYEAGTYQVGSDIPAGEYYVRASSSYYGWLTRKESDSSSDTIAYQSFDSFVFVTVNNGESFTVSNARFTASENAPIPAMDGIWYDAEEYRVGIDLPAGDYYVKATDSYSYIKLYTTSSLTYTDSIVNRSVSSFGYITVKDGEYLLLDDAKICALSDAPTVSADARGRYAAAMYRVGVDIPAGVYYIQPEEDSCYYAVTDNMRTDDCLFNDYFTESRYVALKDGEYISVERGWLTAEENAPAPTASKGKYPARSYRIGVDLPAGSYVVTADAGQSATISVTDSPRGTMTKESQYESFYTRKTITCKEGDYLTVENGTLKIK